MKPIRTCMLCMICLGYICRVASSQADDAKSLIQTAAQKASINAIDAYKYIFDDYHTTVSRFGHNASLSLLTARYEIEFIDGVPLRRQIEENGKPLGPFATEVENKRYDTAVAQVRSMSDEEKRRYVLKHRGLIVDPAQLPELSICKIVGKGGVNNRQAIIVDCKPRENLTLRTRSQNDILHQHIRLWIDNDDTFIDRLEMTLLSDIRTYGKGTTAVMEWTKSDAVWHHTATKVKWNEVNEHISDDGKKNQSGFVIANGETTDIYNHFQKFDVSQRILPGFILVPDY